MLTDKDIEDKIDDKIKEHFQSILEQLKVLIETGHKCKLEKEFTELKTFVKDNIQESLPANLKKIDGELKIQTTLLRGVKSEFKNYKTQTDEMIGCLRKKVRDLEIFKWGLVAKISLISAGIGAIVSGIIYVTARVIIKYLGF